MGFNDLRSLLPLAQGITSPAGLGVRHPSLSCGTSLYQCANVLALHRMTSQSHIIWKSSRNECGTPAVDQSATLCPALVDEVKRRSRSQMKSGVSVQARRAPRAINNVSA